MLVLDTGSNIVRDILTRRFRSLDKGAKADLVMASFCDYDGLSYSITNIGNPVDRNKVLVGVDLSGFKVILERPDVDVKAYMSQFSYAKFIQDNGVEGSSHDLSILLDFESEEVKAVSNPEQLINEIADIKYHVLAAYLIPCFKQVFEENPKPPSPQVIKIRSDEAIYVRPLVDQVELTYRTKFDDDDDFEIGKVFIQEFGESRVAGPGVRAFVGKPPNEVADVFANYDHARAAYVVISLRQQVITGDAKQLNAIKLCLSFRNYLHYHLKCSKAYMHSRMRAQSNHFIKVLNRALPNEEKTEKKTMSGRSFMPQA